MNENYKFLENVMDGDSKEKCVWTSNDGECFGKVKDIPLFNKQLSVPICPYHYSDHMMLMYLHQHGDKVRALTPGADKEARVVDILVEKSVNERCRLFHELSGYEYINRDFCISALIENGKQVEDLVNLNDKELFNELGQFLG